MNPFGTVTVTITNNGNIVATGINLMVGLSSDDTLMSKTTIQPGKNVKLKSPAPSASPPGDAYSTTSRSLSYNGKSIKARDPC